jgi:uncharacterized FlaG/YvyC family protein
VVNPPSHFSGNKNTVEWAAVVVSVLALVVSGGSLGYQAIELSKYETELAGQQEELDNQQEELDNQQKELDNQKQELENQEEEIELASKSLEQSANQFKESGANFRVDTEIKGYQLSLEDAITIEETIRKDEEPNKGDFANLLPMPQPALYEFLSDFPQEKIAMISTVKNTGRSAGLIDRFDLKFESERKYAPKEVLCIENKITIKPCTFPVRVEASDSIQFIMSLNNFIEKELPCVSNGREVINVTVRSADYESYSDIFGVEIVSDFPCSS